MAFPNNRDLAILKEVVRAYRETPTAVQGRPMRQDVQIPLQMAPEVYVAKPQSAGGIAARVGTTPGSGLCDLYEIKDDGDLLAVSDMTKTVYNLSTTAITQDYFSVKRDKFGRWIASTPSGSQSGSAGSFVSYAWSHDIEKTAGVNNHSAAEGPARLITGSAFSLSGETVTVASGFGGLYAYQYVAHHTFAIINTDSGTWDLTVAVTNGTVYGSTTLWSQAQNVSSAGNDVAETRSGGGLVDLDGDGTALLEFQTTSGLQSNGDTMAIEMSIWSVKRD